MARNTADLVFPLSSTTNRASPPLICRMPHTTFLLPLRCHVNPSPYPPILLICKIDRQALLNHLSRIPFIDLPRAIYHLSVLLCCHVPPSPYPPILLICKIDRQALVALYDRFGPHLRRRRQAPERGCQQCVMSSALFLAGFCTRVACLPKTIPRQGCHPGRLGRETTGAP